MGIKTKIISVIILVIVITIFGVYFLADKLNVKQFSYISEQNTYSKYIIFNNYLSNIIENEKNILRLTLLKFENSSEEHVKDLLLEVASSKIDKTCSNRLFSAVIRKDRHDNKYYTIDSLDKEVLYQNIITNGYAYNMSNYKNNFLTYMSSKNDTLYINIYHSINTKDNTSIILRSTLIFNYFRKVVSDTFFGIEKNIVLLDTKNKNVIYLNNKLSYSEELAGKILYNDFTFDEEEPSRIHSSNINMDKKEYKLYSSFIDSNILLSLSVPEVYFTKDISAIGKKLLLYMLIGGFVACLGIILMFNLIFSPINQLVDNIGLAINTKNLSIEMKTISGSDEFSEMTRWINILSTYFQNILYSVKNAITIFKKQSSEIDLKMKNNVNALDRINKASGVIQYNVNNELKQVEISENSNNEIQKYIDTNTQSIEEIESETKNLQSKILDQRVSIEQVVASVEEMSKTVENIDNIIAIASNKSKDLFTTSEQNKDKMLKTSLATKELGNAIVFINNFVLSIRSIAKQTNLLAINAAIEASHAGEHSSGFAVVAEEIRKLSEVSNKQADDATKVLQEIEQKISNTSSELVESSENFDILVSNTKEVNNIMSNVHMASLEQLTAINDMVRSISLLSDTSEHIKSQYMSVVDRLAVVKHDLFTLSRLSENSMQSMISLRNISDEINANVLTVISGSKHLSDITYDMLSLSAQTNKMVNNLDIHINEYKIKDFSKTKRFDNMQLVNGHIISSTKRFLQDRFGDRQYKNWLLSVEPQLYFVLKNKQPLHDWYPLELGYDTLYKSIAKHFYSGNLEGAIKEIVEFNSKTRVPEYIFVIAKMLPLSIVYEIAASTVVNRYFKPSKIEIVKNRNNTLIMHMGDFETPSKIAELGIHYFLKNFSQKLISKTADVQYTKSLYDGDLYCEYVITWS